MSYSIMIVDDHPIVREGLKTVIESTDNLTVVATASDGETALNQLADLSQKPDLVIVDLLMPNMNGESLIDPLLKQNIDILILSTEIDPQVAKVVVKKGIRGYLLKDEAPTQIVESIQRVLEDPNYIAISHEVLSTMMDNDEPNVQFDLTDQQINLLKMIADGKTNAEIARKLFVTTRTVKNYLTAIYNELGVRNRAQAIAVAAKNKLI